MTRPTVTVVLLVSAAISLSPLQTRAQTSGQDRAGAQGSQTSPAASAAEQEIIRRLREQLRANPNDVQALLGLAGADVKGGDPAAAAPLLAKAAQLDPKSAAIRINWAAVLARLHRYADADRALDGVTPPADAGQGIEYWRIAASVALGRGDAPRAARDMEAALAAAPQNSALVLATGLAEVAARQWSKAIQHLSPVFASTHNPRAGLALVQAEAATHQDVSQTLAALDGLDLSPPEDSAFRVQLGELLAGAGLPQPAAHEFERAARESPPSAELDYDLALAQFRAGKSTDALANARRAQELADGGAIENLLGEIEESRGESLAAVHSFQAAVKLDPGNQQYQAALGLELLQHQTYKPARAVFQAAVQRFPQSSRLRIALGITDYLLEDYGAAAKDLMAAGYVGRDNTLAYQYLGETQLEQPETPSPDAVAQLCRYSDAHPGEGKLMAYCGALLARVAQQHGAPAPPLDALRRLRVAARLVPSDAVARCELGKADQELKQWTPAKRNLEACARLTPDSPEAHYRLAQVCRTLHDMTCAQRELKLHDAAVQHIVKANAQRDRTLKKFLYTMKASPVVDSR
jgi:predicted Zn-dependent protease